MTLNIARCREYLESFNFGTLFVEELGWDQHTADMSLDLEGAVFQLHAVAEKRGVQVFECRSDNGTGIPAYNTRKRIEKQVAKNAYEHLIIFTEASRTTQIWQWVARAPSQPDAYREISYLPLEQTGDLLLQKLMVIRFTLDEEESIDIAGASHRLRDAFDRDKVTKKFFNEFKKEHAAFLSFINGLAAKGDREWYASLMLNRLMFVWFIQKKRFLDGDTSYLQNRLDLVKKRKGNDKFHTFYRYFLLTLFHQGFARQPSDRELDSELVSLLGEVPYLNGGLFDLHQLEIENQDIHIPDKAFEGLFNFFGRYDWHLDTRTVRTGSEINPDVLGYIFEKYINQKQMGAYYTKEDITEYIGKNTIVPFLFDSAKKKCAIAFQPGSALWNLLRDNPDRYIYAAMRKGVINKDGAIMPLPPEIEEGVDTTRPNLLERRKNWNGPASPEYALPTETWREHVARRQRCLEIREKLESGEIHDSNDLITYNLNIRQFAQDAIAECEGPDLLRAFWQALLNMTILDPTCGSGAFLFAALEILLPLYEACLVRMQAFVEDLERSGEKHSPKKFSDFRQVLEDVDRHPNRTYFILKSIIIRNLYGVDIMPEAVEICKLRLFLKLVAQIGSVAQLEPLPDIDFNIRAGNTLVGYAMADEVRRAFQEQTVGRQVQYKLMMGDTQSKYEEFEERVELAARQYRLFQKMQTEYGMEATEFSAAKRNLRLELSALGDELNGYLGAKYGVNPKNKREYDKWLTTHQPFHWFVEFYGVMTTGGFDVIVGNPPYVEYSKIKKSYTLKNYSTMESGNLYAFASERGLNILNSQGSFGFIVPISTVCTQRMKALQEKIYSSASSVWYSDYAERPSKLFEGAEVLLTIILARKSMHDEALEHTTGFLKWAAEERPWLFDRLTYCRITEKPKIYVVPKLSGEIAKTLLAKLMKRKGVLARRLQKSSAHPVYYRIGGGRYWKIFTTFQPQFALNEKPAVSSRENYLFLPTAELRNATISVLSSSLFYWYFIQTTNCRDLNPSDLSEFPLELAHIEKNTLTLLDKLCNELMSDYKGKSQLKKKTSKLTGEILYQEFYPRLSKAIIDRIDCVLAKDYGFTEEELDFIINYEIKYRMGKSLSDGEENETSDD